MTVCDTDAWLDAFATPEDTILLRAFGRQRLRDRVRRVLVDWLRRYGLAAAVAFTAGVGAGVWA